MSLSKLPNPLHATQKRHLESKSCDPVRRIYAIFKKFLKIQNKTKKHGKSHRQLKRSQRNFDELLCQTTLPDRFQVCTSALLSVRSHHLSLSKS